MAQLIPEESQVIRSDGQKLLNRYLPLWHQLPKDITDLLIDQLILIANINKSKFKGREELIDMFDGSKIEEDLEVMAKTVYSDYSFLVAPSYKALEGFLIFLADRFGLPAEKHKKRIGFLYDWEAVDKKLKKQILSTLNKRFSSFTDKDIRREGMDRWKELAMILRTYRHSPAHFSEKAIDTFEQAEGYTKTIVTTISQMMEFLTRNRMLPELNRPDIKEVVFR